MATVMEAYKTTFLEASKPTFREALLATLEWHKSYF